MESQNYSYSRIGSSSYHRRLRHPGWKEVIHTWSVPDICYFLQTNTTEVKINTYTTYSIIDNYLIPLSGPDIEKS